MLLAIVTDSLAYFEKRTAVDVTANCLAALLRARVPEGNIGFNGKSNRPHVFGGSDIETERCEHAQVRAMNNKQLLPPV